MLLPPNHKKPNATFTDCSQKPWIQIRAIICMANPFIFTSPKIGIAQPHIRMMQPYVMKHLVPHIISIISYMSQVELNYLLL